MSDFNRERVVVVHNLDSLEGYFSKLRNVRGGTDSMAPARAMGGLLVARLRPVLPIDGKMYGGQTYQLLYDCQRTPTDPERPALPQDIVKVIGGNPAVYRGVAMQAARTVCGDNFAETAQAAFRGLPKLPVAPFIYRTDWPHPS